MSHKFGGVWTRKKLHILSKYLAFYTQALKNQSFKLHYVDAFAGTGTHVPATADDGQEALVDHDAMEGSVMAALDTEPSFHNYHFNDLNQNHIAQLENLRDQYPRKQISITQSDANDFVADFCRAMRWDDRAVLFVDPYSTELDWDTLKHVARSEKIDLWLLFPISALTRMTPRSEEQIRPEWAPTINRLVGTDSWEDALYKPIDKPPMDDLFGELENEGAKQRLNTEELGRWVTDRLQELFPYVSDPVPLKNNNRPLFNFYFIVSNPHKKAQDLARKVVKHILKDEF